MIEIEVLNGIAVRMRNFMNLISVLTTYTSFFDSFIKHDGID